MKLKTQLNYIFINLPIQNLKTTVMQQLSKLTWGIQYILAYKVHLPILDKRNINNWYTFI